MTTYECCSCPPKRTCPIHGWTTVPDHTTGSHAAIPTVMFWVCKCCPNHSDMPLVANKKATCPECGEPCSCPGCIAEDGHV